MMDENQILIDLIRMVANKHPQKGARLVQRYYQRLFGLEREEICAMKTSAFLKMLEDRSFSPNELKILAEILIWEGSLFETAKDLVEAYKPLKKALIIFLTLEKAPGAPVSRRDIVRVEEKIERVYCGPRSDNNRNVPNGVTHSARSQSS